MTDFKLKRKDKLGRPIRIGDWVRLVEIPPSIKDMPRNTRLVFRCALGKTFKIEGFNLYNLTKFDLTKKWPSSTPFGLSRSIFCCLEENEGHRNRRYRNLYPFPFVTSVD
jgi:hypothetical protein